MPEYIEREAIIRLAESISRNIDPNFPTEAVTVLANFLPAADVVAVKHGRWVTDECDPGEPDGYAAFIEVHCSECECALGVENGQHEWYYGDPFPMRYCPNCGAKMDQKEECR